MHFSYNTQLIDYHALAYTPPYTHHTRTYSNNTHAFARARKSLSDLTLFPQNFSPSPCGRTVDFQ